MFENPIILFILFPVIAYVIGSTPSGVIIASARGIDLRKSGSGNVGATNVGRVLGKGWGYLCFALDVAKGLLPVLAAGIILKPDQGHPEIFKQAAWLLVGCGAILGHVFSFWLGFRGGKGVATALGVVVGIYPYFTYAGLIAFGGWIVITLISRYVSLGSIVAAILFVPLIFVLNHPASSIWPMIIFASAMSALIIVRHRTNILRLLAGTENKIGSKKQVS